MDRLLGRLAPIGVDGLGIRRHDQEIGSELARQQLRAQILVDHRFDTDQLPVVALFVHCRNAAATRTDDDGALFQQPSDRADLEDAFGRRRGDDTPPFFAILLENPALFLGDPVSLGFLIDGADELRGVLEARIGGIDLHHGQQRGQRLLERQEIAEFLFQHVTDHALGLGAENIERIGFLGFVGRPLQRKQPHLRPVAVGDDDLMFGRQWRDRLSRDARVPSLGIGGHGFPAPQKRIAAKRNHHTHVNLPGSRQAGP